MWGAKIVSYQGMYVQTRTHAIVAHTMNKPLCFMYAHVHWS